jgi:hypothetical protein
MKQQTAVEWFVKEIQTRLTNDGEVNYVQLAKEAKAKEKEQITDAFNSGLAYDYDDSETYYNKTYTNGL